jgi:hypothetical protein
VHIEEEEVLLSALKSIAVANSVALIVNEAGGALKGLLQRV